MNRLGERIKKRREQLNLQLGELASRIGVSASAMSQIEKAKSFPSIITLKNIAESLHTTVGELIGENESLANNPVVKRDEMEFVDQNKSGTTFYLLSQHDVNKQMDTYLIRFSKSSSLEGRFSGGVGQIFCHVLSGQVRFELEDKTYLMMPGDSIYFNARSRFDIVNYADSLSEALWVQSPPNF